MPRTAQTKKTSEERCLEAFEKEFHHVQEDLTSAPYLSLWLGWQACWRYLEKQVREEFIER